jgi:hypothetical protein
VDFLSERWGDPCIELRPPPPQSSGPALGQPSLADTIDGLKLRQALILMVDAKPQRPHEWLREWLADNKPEGW